MQLPTAESRMADIDTLLSRIEGIVDQIVQRLTSLEGRMNSLNNRLDNMDMRLDNMEGRMASHLKWIIGLLLTILIAIFGTSITILMNLPK
ncbi:MAG: hypothetical protein F4Y39_11805 [Gemmatimonadetes bacterium]|nr:hypothetical protein [Gemmatimonadota bacterium]MYF72868.1 hypothetical protein [Gemmatimonadota bacterium]MYK50308.1 hypothetical protein [Gemmatimonadota bacterium]